MSSAIDDAMATAIAHRLLPDENREVKRAVTLEIKTDAEARSSQWKTKETQAIAKLLREEMAQKKSHRIQLVIDAYEARLNELKRHVE